MFHTYSLNLVRMNKLVELKGNDKLKMQNDKNYAIFLEGKWICEISIHESFIYDPPLYQNL